MISIHALREEGDQDMDEYRTPYAKFQSTPSARRATKYNKYKAIRQNISIHALREEGDCDRFKDYYEEKNFNPRPPRGGRPNPLDLIAHHKKISIHALREEGDGIDPRDTQAINISIHALREEGDFPSLAKNTDPSDFNPRPPRGGRRCRR